MHHFHLKPRGPIKKLHYAFASLQVRSLIERFRPDVINAHYASGYGFMAAQAIRKLPVPLVTNLWGSDILIVPQISTLHRLKTIRALKAASHVLADSQYLLIEARKLFDFNSGTVIPWGLERNYISADPGPAPSSLPLKIIVPRPHASVYNNEFILSSVRDLVRANKINITFPNFGTDLDQFKTQAGNLLEHGVSLYGRMGRREFVSFVAGYDVYLSASRSDSSPASLIESMGLGLISVVADIKGVREWASNGGCVTFTQDDPESLCDALQKVIENPAQFDEMRFQNHTRVKTEACFEDNIATQIKIMNNLAGRG